MSIDFNGTTAKAEHTTATGFDTATLTIAAWTHADGQGGGSLGRVLQADETSTAGGNAGQGFVLCHNNAVNTLRFIYAHTSTGGAWQFPATDSVWNAVGVSYDRTALANLPVARVNFASVASTAIASPIGSPTGPAAGYCIGNRTGADRGWDGRIAHLQFFNVILAAEEMDAALRKPGSIRRGLVAWWPLYAADYVAQYVGGGPASPTATALATGAGPPCAMPMAAQHGWQGNPGAAAAPSGGAVRLAGQRFRLAGSPGGLAA